MGLGVWVFGGRDTAHRHPAPYSRSLLGRDRPYPHHNGTDSTWFKGIEGVSMCGVFDFLDSHLVTFWGGEEQIYRPVHEDISAGSSNYHVSDARGSGIVCCILKIRLTKGLHVSSTRAMSG